MKKAEREALLAQKLTDMSQLEKELYAKGIEYVAGVDEVGRGPLCGPVVAACVVLPKDWDIVGLDDSKKLTEKRREAMYDIIREHAIAYGIGSRDNNVIDEVNILEATKLAMVDAIREAEKMLRRRITQEDALKVVSGSTQIGHVLFDALKIESVPIPQSAIVKGDSKSISIAAASILAKVTRDRYMVEMDAKYPGYAFASNKGYGTKAHYEGIREHGITPIHRKSFLKNVKY